ncbi:MAG TPA: YlxR family protein [Acidimicrobiia bacterium]
MAVGFAGEPIRSCIGCRAREPRSALVRIVADPSAPGGCVVDADRTRPGRGAHIHPRAECVEKARRTRALARALRISAAGVDIEQVRSLIRE